jgi:DNA repair protein RecO (recombination protein O)
LSQTIHKTKGIVLRTVKYGETSIITSVYTELFGVQSYLVKGARRSSNKSQGKASYFQPAALLDIEVYHNELKNLQFVKSFSWGYLYQNLLFDVVRNAVAMYVIELLQHSLKQPEANPELFYLIEDTLKQIDTGSNTLVSNVPLYFTLHLASELGFQMQGEYSKQTSILDLQDGNFVATTPPHPYYIDGMLAQTISQINSINFYNDLEAIKLNKEKRRQLLHYLQQYVALHINEFGEMKSIEILQTVLA